MTAILKSLHHWESRLDRRAERFALRHPNLALLFMLVAMPIFILAAVIACTMLLAAPLALILGWV
ncbi:MAG: hypothetical protein Q4F17_02065 [Eubacteriales bacterium]|nr:hypothetical protein [Eubacteriales bacterium]